MTDLSVDGSIIFKQILLLENYDCGNSYCGLVIGTVWYVVVNVSADHSVSVLSVQDRITSRKTTVLNSHAYFKQHYTPVTLSDRKYRFRSVGMFLFSDWKKYPYRI
jgi:hypothetical protein